MENTEKEGEWKEVGWHLGGAVSKGDVFLICHMGGAYSAPDRLVSLPATVGDFCAGIHHCSEHSKLPFFPLIAGFHRFRKNTRQIYCINLF